MAGEQKIGAARRRRIVGDFIRNGDAVSQEAIVNHLADRGIAVTQATVSRDLDAIGAIKVRIGGRQGYALTEDVGGAPDLTEERLQELFSEWILAAESAGHLVVIRTPPGSAHMIGDALDRVSWDSVAGTVAGDDTIMVIARDGHPVKDLLARVKSLAALD
ncbi:arginine repressor [Euryhalocaulis caribicus]|uniref:arginine repressor n=1 Tax=Euryhalocaulis caribicus TaxID=1161401 RepID=UPI000399C7EA|nr:arginine repressor [Euryhalocaulis caribicus]